MPKLTVEGFETVEVEEGKRLVLAIEQDAHVDVLHACGGNARCTTCRVVFVSDEPEVMTVAEKDKLIQKAVPGIRLSCQIRCDRDMTVRAISRLEGSGRPDPGPTPMTEITPEAQWVAASELPAELRAAN
jgi:ferredoxin